MVKIISITHNCVAITGSFIILSQKKKNKKPNQCSSNAYGVQSSSTCCNLKFNMNGYEPIKNQIVFFKSELSITATTKEMTLN